MGMGHDMCVLCGMMIPAVFQRVGSNQAVSGSASFSLPGPPQVEYDDLQFIERLGKGEFGEAGKTRQLSLL